jgi:hypothetical protein
LESFTLKLDMNVSVMVPETFDSVLREFSQENWTIWDGRNKSWNWFYYDFIGPFHPPGIWGSPNKIRRGEFEFTLSPETLVQLSEEMWNELYDELAWSDPNVPKNLLDATEYCQKNLSKNSPGLALLPYLNVAVFFYLVGETGHPLTWVFESPLT